VSQYEDLKASRAAVASRSGPGGTRGDEYDRGYSSDFDYERPSSRRDSDYGDEYADGGYTLPAESGSTAALPPPRGFDEEAQRPPRIAWTSAADLGLLVMRLVLGGIFAAHGAQKVFGWFNGAGLDGFAGFLSEQGYKQADALSAAAGFAELVGGLLVIFGVFTPLAAAGLLSVMINAIWLQWDSGLFVEDGGFELELALAGLAAGLVFTGPGRVALDNGRAWFRHPVVTGWLCLLAGAAAGVAVYVVYHGL
jgi:putative oxidoreductase